MQLRASDITPVTKIRNEEYWIEYVLRDVCEVFGRFIMYDTGSTDRTKEIARHTAQKHGAELWLIEDDCGNDPNKIGNAPNVLREMCETHWMMLVDGDEIWRTDQLKRLLTIKVPDDTEVIMVTGRNLTHQNGSLVQRDTFSADRLFSPVVRWGRTDYPFESHFLEKRVERGVVAYLPVWFWHTRHLQRSSQGDAAYFRQQKRDYFPYDGPFTPLPDEWLGKIGKYPNPYLRVT